MSLLDKAQSFAHLKHLGQKRKHGDRPYIYHPAKVVEYLQLNGYHDENLLSAAWLHDLVEDVADVTYNTLKEEFNEAIAELVREVSHPPTAGKLSRFDRWGIYLEHYENASTEGQILKLADRYCNLQEYVDFWDEVDTKGRRFLRNIYLNESNDLIDALFCADERIFVDLVNMINYLDELCSED